MNYYLQSPVGSCQPRDHKVSAIEESLQHTVQPFHAVVGRKDLATKRLMRETTYHQPEILAKSCKAEVWKLR